MKNSIRYAGLMCCLIFAVFVAWPVAAGQEEAAIEKTIAGVSRAFSEFPKTKNRQSILGFYGKDFSSIQDGRFYSAKEYEKYLAEIEGQLRTSPMSISSKVSNIKTQVAGAVAWAFYDYEFTIARGNQVLEHEQGKCTAILKKESAAWLIQHEHCSKLAEDDKQEKV